MMAMPASILNWRSDPLFVDASFGPGSGSPLQSMRRGGLGGVTGGWPAMRQGSIGLSSGSAPEINGGWRSYLRSCNGGFGGDRNISSRKLRSGSTLHRGRAAVEQKREAEVEKFDDKAEKSGEEKEGDVPESEELAEGVSSPRPRRPKISGVELHKQTGTVSSAAFSGKQKQNKAGRRASPWKFINLAEEWASFTGPREKGDVRDVVLMSFAFAVYIYISQHLVHAYCAFKNVYHNPF